MPPGMRHLPFGAQRRRAATGRDAQPQALDPGHLDATRPAATVASLVAVQYSPRTSTRALRVEALARHADLAEHALAAAGRPDAAAIAHDQRPDARA